jgi:hypothetical protein
VITWRLAVYAAQCTVSEGLRLPHGNCYKIMCMQEGYVVRFCKTAVSAF